MAFSLSLSSLLVAIAALAVLLSHVVFSLRIPGGGAWTDFFDGWLPGGATWYGSPTGAGSDGGACGYGNAVGSYPFNSMITAGNPNLFKSGKGCGACYEVKCTGNEACSGNPVRVAVTDECPGGACLAEPVHFDLSGAAFSAMAVPGKEGELRNVGVLHIQYRRSSCNYDGAKIAFQMDAGSNPYYFAVVIKFMAGDGDLLAVELQTRNATWWMPMHHSWGAVWMMHSGSPLRGPFSIKLTTLTTLKSIVAQNVIPEYWSPGKTYSSTVNY